MFRDVPVYAWASGFVDRRKSGARTLEHGVNARSRYELILVSVGWMAT
jgi:hypothetical protein